MRHKFTTQGVCAKTVEFDLDGDVVKNVLFHGGCSGNLRVIQGLIEGFTVAQIQEKLAGSRCGPRPTSCADQLAKGVLAAYEKEKA